MQSGTLFETETKTYQLNVLDIKPMDGLLLHLVLQQELLKHRKIFFSHEYFPFPTSLDESTEVGQFIIDLKKKYTSIRVSHFLYRRQCGMNPEDSHIDILGMRLGDGNYGVVYLLVGKLYQKENGFRYQSGAIKNVLKLEDITQCKADDSFNELLPDETLKNLCLKASFLTLRMDELNAKPVAIFSNKEILAFNNESITYGHLRYFAVTVMRYIDGSSLTKILDQDKFSQLSGQSKVPFLVRLNLSYETARALQRMHAVRIIHRDVKPANVILCSNKKAVFVDLGCAQDTAFFEGNYGTPAFAPPEFFINLKTPNTATQPLKQSSDVFSWGWMQALWWGGAKGPAKTLQDIVNFSKNDFTQLNALFEKVEIEHSDKEFFSQLIQKALRQQPETRISMYEAVEEIDMLLKEHFLRASPTQKELIQAVFSARSLLRKEIDEFTWSHPEIDLNEWDRLRAIVVKALDSVSVLTPTAIYLIFEILEVSAKKPILRKCDLLDLLDEIKASYAAQVEGLLQIKLNAEWLSRQSLNLSERKKLVDLSARVDHLLMEFKRPMTLANMSYLANKFQKYVALFGVALTQMNTPAGPLFATSLTIFSSKSFDSSRTSPGPGRENSPKAAPNRHFSQKNAS